MNNVKKNLEVFGIIDMTVSAYVEIKGRTEARWAKITLDQPIPAANMAVECLVLAQRAEVSEDEVTNPTFRLYAKDQKVCEFTLQSFIEPIFVDDEGEEIDPPDVLIDAVEVWVLRTPVRKAQVAEYESLAHLCGQDREKHLAFTVERQKEESFPSDLMIVCDGKLIGTVSNGRFRYDAATELRDTIGWLLASDLGQEKILPDFDLDGTVRRLAQFVVRRGTGPHSFEDWKGVLKTIFVCGRTVRGGDTYLAVSNLLWKVATRRYLGEEHEGYSFGM